MSSQKKITIYRLATGLFIFSLLLTACASPTPSPAPTPIPIPPAPVVLQSISQEELVSATWQWVGLRETAPAAQSVVPDAENYTITFNNEDGSVNIKADCNVALGSYTLSGNQLTISMGPTTLAECGPESSYSQFLTLLEQASGVGMGYGNLVVTLANDAGEMYLQRATTNSLIADLDTIAQEDLIDTLWEWVSLIEMMPASQSLIANSENYTLVFRADGTYSAKADCNQLLGEYEMLGSQLKFSPGITTLAECEPGSSYDIYRDLLERVTGVGARDGALVLALAEEAGIMNFENRGPAPEEQTMREPVQGDPAVLLGDPDGRDAFNDKSNWTLFDGECFKSEINGGNYIMTSKGIPENSCWEVSWPKIQNFYIETIVENPDTCDPLDRFGMLLRAPDNNRGYLFGLTCSGSYSLTLWDGKETTVLIEPAGNDAIQQGPGLRNRLGIAVTGGEFYLYANGEYLDQVEDLTYLDEGKIGYFVRAFTDQPFTVRHDELKIWILDDTFYPPQAKDPGFPITDLPEPPASSATMTANVNVNIRSGPGMQFKVINVALKGDKGEVLGVSPDGYWYNVPIPPGISSYETGWLAKDYVTLSIPAGKTLRTITPPLLPGLVPVEPPPSGSPSATILERGGVRNGPGIEYPIYGLTSVAVQVSVVGKSQDEEWWAIKLPASYTPDGLGWMNKIYLATRNVANVPVLKAPLVPEDARPTAPGGGQPAAKALETLNVTSGPGNQYMSYGKAPAGTIMSVIGVSTDGEYWVIQLPEQIAKDKRGWVPVRFTDASKTDNKNVPEIPSPPLP